MMRIFLLHLSAQIHCSVWAAQSTVDSRHSW